MPIIKSAKKRVRVASKAAVRNSKTKRSLRTAIKQFQVKISGDAIAKAQSELDKAVKKGVISKNKAARKKKQLASQAKAAGVKASAAPKAKKAAPKAAKPTAKPAAKPAAKKTVAKKATAKKTAAKKT